MNQLNYLKFLVKTLTVLNLWPQKHNRYAKIAQFYVPTIVAITTTPILADLIVQFYEDEVYFTSINENLVALSALLAVIYVSICFIQRKIEIATLISDLKIFETYSPKNIIEDTDKSVKFYTRLFIIYGIVGNISYGLLPVIGYHNCQLTKSDHMVKYGIPCGLIVRFLLPLKFDFFPMAELVAMYEAIICILGTTVVVIISMLICGVLLHITTQLKYLKKTILEMSDIENETILQKQIKFCVEFHTVIVDYSTRVDLCFNRMMLMHITWTGIIISILGFEITTSSNYIEAIRFFMHLLGWLGMLFLVCYYGQNLMDESIAISDAIYSFLWYQKSVFIQKYVILILLRSQKPLTLKACGIKVMSLATFIGVLYSAYSYFTLLLKLS